MAVFSSDNFADSSNTLLSSHTPSGGGSWTIHSSGTYGGTLYVSDANRLRYNTSGGNPACYYHSGTPATAEYDVQVDLYVVTTTEDRAYGPCGRIATGANTMYMARYSQGAGQWQMFKIVAGSATSLGTYSQSLSGTTSYACKLEIRDAAKKVYIDGTERISSADNAVTAAGKAGVRDGTGVASTDATGYHLDNFTATDAPSTFDAATFPYVLTTQPYPDRVAVVSY